MSFTLSSVTRSLRMLVVAAGRNPAANTAAAVTSTATTTTCNGSATRRYVGTMSRKQQHNRKRQQQFRMWMPTMPLTMVSAKNATATRPAYAIFRTLPKMTKHEIKEYLTKIYDLPVQKVNTMNYQGKRKRVLTQSGIHYYKYKDFKKAVVTFDDTLQDVGLGMRIPELEEEEDNNIDVV